MEIAAITIGKTILLFLFTLLCFRLMGYRSLGDMEPLDYVIVLGIGEIMGSPLSANHTGIVLPLIAIGTLTVLQISLSAIYAKIPKVEKIMEGKPIPVIRNGKILKKNLSTNRIDMEALMEELRIKGLRDESDVDIANLEPSGRFSVILKSEASPVTPRFFGEQSSYYIASHGNIDPWAWNNSGLKQDTVLDYLRSQNIQNWSEVDTLIYKNGNFFLKRREN